MYYNYLIISSAMVSKIRFGQVKETGPEFLRYNADNTKTFVKWDCGNTGIAKTTVIDSYMPDCIFRLKDTYTSRPIIGDHFLLMISELNFVKMNGLPTKNNLY